jgi:hypothetical protein
VCVCIYIYITLLCHQKDRINCVVMSRS